MKALWCALILVGVIGCRQGGMRTYTVHSSQYDGISDDSPFEGWNSSQNQNGSSQSQKPIESSQPGNQASDAKSGTSVPALPAPKPPLLLPPPQKKSTPPLSGGSSDKNSGADESTLDPDGAGGVPVPGKTGSAASSDSRKDSENLPLPNPAANSQDFVSKGTLIPSVYYQPLLIDNDSLCASSRKVSLRSPKGVALMMVCPQTLSACSLEGSCRISQNGIIRSFNVAGGSASSSTFFELGKEDCFFGFGVSSICLDPFFTVAADLRYYNPGDVIFVPALVGGILPNGEKHTGFLIVRDRGAGIRGPNRFDFFSGTLTWQDPTNPFGQIHLADKRTRVDYFAVKGESAKRILEHRGYPRIPLARRH